MAKTIKDEESLRVEGTVERIYFSKPTFTTGRIVAGFDTFNFRLAGFAAVGESIAMRGEWVNDPKWGRQFNGRERLYELPADVKGLASWMQWNATGIGPARATKLVETFGMKLPEFLSCDPAQVAIEAKVPIEVVEALAAKWVEFAARVGLQTRLAGMGLTQNQVNQIVEKYKGSAVAILEHDAYTLLGEIDGLGFAKIDALARKAGMSPTDPKRLRAALEWTVRRAFAEDGSTCVPAPLAQDAAVSLLAQSDDLGGHVWDVAGIAADLAASGRIVVVPGGGGEQFYATPAAYRAESFLRTFFRDGNRPNPLASV